MEGTHLEITGMFVAHQSANTFLHLASSLVRERQGKYLPGLHTLFQQPGYLIGQDTRLSRASTSDDQTCSITVEHCITLTIIQLLKYIVVHYCCLGKTKCKVTKNIWYSCFFS